MNNVIKRVWNQNRMGNIEDLNGMTFQDESEGHTFQISGVDDAGNTVALTGSVAGVFLRPDNTDVAISGSVSGGVVSVTLPPECYDVPGRFGLTVFVTDNGQKTAVYAAVGTVSRTSSGTVSPGTSADAVDLINRINAAVATIPASWTGLMADIAPTYSASAVYPVGAYCYYNGDLYRCTTAITTAESWTAGHWTQAVLGQDVSDLKAAIKDIDFGDFGHAFGRMNWLEWDASKDVFVDKTYIGGYGDSTGTPAPNPNLCMTKLLKIKPNTIYCVSRMNNDPAALQRATFYTEAEVFDSSIFGSGISKNARNVQYFTTPSTAGYVRLIFATADYETNFNNIKMQTGENESTVTIPVSERFINPQNANIGMTAIYQSLMTNRFWGTNDYEDSQKRLSFRVPLLTKNALEVSCKTGYLISVNTYSKTNENTYNLINGSGWVAKTVSVPADSYFVANLKKTDESNITVAEKINVSFSYENGTDEAIKNLIQRIDSVGVNTYYRRMFSRKVWTSTGSASSTTRLAFNEIQYTDKELTLFIDSGYKVSVMYFDSEGEYISSSGWKKNTWKTEANKYFVILVAKTDDSTILLDEISAFHIQYDVDSNLEKAIQNIDNEIKNIDNEIKNNVKKELDDITKLPGKYYPQSHQTGVPKPLKLLMFGDIHADATRLSRIVNYLNASDVDDAIALGDIIAGYFDDPFDFWGQSNADDIILVIGDHDPKDRTTQDVYDYDRVTQQGVYEKFLSPYIANWGVTYTSNKTYYYKDYADSGIRLICIDSSLRDIPAKSVTDNTEQLSWFASTLADAKAEGLTVIVACHWPISYRTLFNCSFSAITHDPNQSDSESMNTYLRPAYMEAVQTFVNGGGKFACYLTGHTHLDKVYYYRKYPNQIAFTTSCASAEDWVHATMHWDDLDRTGDAQDLFNIVTIDTNTKTMKLQRIGADRDIFGRGRHFTCIDYSLGKVIASD